MFLMGAVLDNVTFADALEQMGFVTGSLIFIGSFAAAAGIHLAFRVARDIITLGWDDYREWRRENARFDRDR